MVEKQSIKISTEEEMVVQLKLLLNNGYDVAVRKYDNGFGVISYQLVYQKCNVKEMVGEGE